MFRRMGAGQHVGDNVLRGSELGKHVRDNVLCWSEFGKHVRDNVLHLSGGHSNE